MPKAITVLGRDSSVNVQKVMWCAAELGLDVTRHDIGGAFGGNDTPDYLAKNPNGKIPVMIDGDHIMWESNAIVRYLVDQDEEGAWQPRTAQARGIAGQWMDWALGELQPPMTVIFWTLIRTAPEDRNLEALAAGIRDAGRVLAMLDQHLENRAYVAGDTPSCGDIPVGSFVNRWFQMEIERPPLKNLDRWYSALSQRPAYKAHVMLPLT
jgi:glutathione S-transferase